MTTDHNAVSPDAVATRPSLLPFNPGDLLAMRVLPAEFARMVGVSKQAVSQWIKRGTIELGPDGRLEPKRAARQVIERTDPARLRARVFQQAAASYEELRARIRALEAELATGREQVGWREQAMRYRVEDETAQRLRRLSDALVARFDAAIDAHATGHLNEWLDGLVAVEFYGQDEAEYHLLMDEAPDIEPPDLSRVGITSGTDPGQENPCPA